MGLWVAEDTVAGALAGAGLEEVDSVAGAAVLAVVAHRGDGNEYSAHL